VMTSFKTVTCFVAEVILREIGRTNGPEVGENVNVGASPQCATFIRNHVASEEESRNWTFFGSSTSPPERTLRPNQYALDPLLSSTCSSEGESEDVWSSDATGESVGAAVGTGIGASVGTVGDGSTAEGVLQEAEHSSEDNTTCGILALFNTSVPPSCTLP